MNDKEGGGELYFVVVNDQEQYSIWSAGQELPSGWRKVGGLRTRAECLAHIELEWTDTRPTSLRPSTDSLGEGSA